MCQTDCKDNKDSILIKNSLNNNIHSVKFGKRNIYFSIFSMNIKINRENSALLFNRLLIAGRVGFVDQEWRLL
jgi:hypothetical protein